MQIRAGLGKNSGLGAMVEIGPGLMARERIKAHFDSPDLPYVVVLEAHYSGERYEVTSLKCERRPGGPAITTEGIRRLPVTEMLQFAAIGHVWTPNQGHLFDVKPVRPHLQDDATLEYVAKLYRAASVTQEDPAKAVMQNLELPRATASRWIKRARERGFLTDPAPRRPKEDL